MFKEYRISEIGEVIGGGTPSTKNEEYWNGDIPWISPKDLTGYTSVFIRHGESNITEKGLNKSGTKLLPKNTVLFSSRAPIGYVALAANPICTNQGFKSIVCNEQLINPLYLYYYLKVNLDYIKLFGSGATFPEISGSALRNIKISIFENVERQIAVANAIYKYDELIELNNKRIKLLEQAAEELYKEWFVRFRFPNYQNTEFENGIPKGWEIKRIKEVCSITAGGDRPECFSETKSENCSVPIFSNGITDDGLYGYTDRARIHSESVTISARGTVGVVFLRREPYVPIVRLLALEPTHQISSFYLYHYLKNSGLEGNGTSQQQITSPMIQKRKILIPSRSILTGFDTIAKKFYDSIDIIKHTNNNLIKQRDYLLPRLMSGKLEV